MNIDDLRSKPLLTVAEVGQILRIGRTSTYEYLRNSPPFRVMRVQNRIRIPSKDLFNWIDGNKGSQQ